jgi:ABC-2 type transport system ATP-binding protein
MHRKVGTFSKGMTQLLGFAQAMIGKPSIYILDEPTIGLDARWLKVARDKIKKLNEESATIIFSSHILTEVQALCDRVAIINKGKMVAEDSVSNLSKHLNIKPRLEISVEGLNGKVPDFVLKIGGVEGAEAKEDMLFVTCDAASRLDVITTLKKKGLDIRNFKTIEPSLEEVFIRLTSGEKGGA